MITEANSSPPPTARWRRSARRSTQRSTTPRSTLDWSLNDGILEIDCGDGGKIIVNRHVPNREIWVAARSGGFHFRAERRPLARHAVGRRARGATLDARCCASRRGLTVDAAGSLPRRRCGLACAARG